MVMAKLEAGKGTALWSNGIQHLQVGMNSINPDVWHEKEIV